MMRVPTESSQDCGSGLRRRPSFTRWVWREWFKPVLAALLIVTAFRSAIADWNDVPTGSMKPTVLEGDRVFVNRLAYDLKFPYTTWHLATWSNPQRGDIVVLYSPADGTRLLKRVIGLPGDQVEMRENQLRINGHSADYVPSEGSAGPQPPQSGSGAHRRYEEVLEAGRHEVLFTGDTKARRSFAPVTIPESHYLVLGDNRDQSFDSRYFGLVERSKILGRATAVAMSFDPSARYRPRWERLATSLR